MGKCLALFDCICVLFTDKQDDSSDADKKSSNNKSSSASNTSNHRLKSGEKDNETNGQLQPNSTADKNSVSFICFKHILLFTN